MGHSDLVDVPEQTEGHDGDDGGAAESPVGDGPASARLGEQTAAAIRHARAALGISQRRLATRVGLSKSAVARLERGEVRLSAGTLTDLLDRLGFSLSLEHYRWCARDSGSPSWQLHEPWAHRLLDPGCARWLEHGGVVHRDDAGRAFPAHGLDEWVSSPPHYWVVRHDFQYFRRGLWLWHHPPDRPQ